MAVNFTFFSVSGSMYACRHGPVQPALVIAGVVSALWMQPIMALTFSLLKLVLSPLSFLLH